MAGTQDQNIHWNPTALSDVVHQLARRTGSAYRHAKHDLRRLKRQEACDSHLVDGLEASLVFIASGLSELGKLISPSGAMDTSCGSGDVKSLLHLLQSLGIRMEKAEDSAGTHGDFCDDLVKSSTDDSKCLRDTKRRATIDTVFCNDPWASYQARDAHKVADSTFRHADVVYEIVDDDADLESTGMKSDDMSSISARVSCNDTVDQFFIGEPCDGVADAIDCYFDDIEVRTERCVTCDEGAPSVSPATESDEEHLLLHVSTFTAEGSGDPLDASTLFSAQRPGDHDSSDLMGDLTLTSTNVRWDLACSALDAALEKFRNC
eukprot:gnl/MRDRNA2_/MRDRNA2_32667_c0_seq1.p1 gnl/MRDRNA2_/MRDRNA2_32667_c0~~gnl/MRDRNA2_/MRDRNA2_32667_c0_seq1.p1  ORF type:complete len:320 (-),score=65.69 gnl/MRDRNA2_/MRDRNA2_32667_c0_seq1:657-1616(-)